MTSPAEAAYQQAEGRSEAIRQLVLDHLYLVNRAVDRVAGMVSADAPREDLIGAGMLGLVEAAHRYDEGKQASFKTFAYYRVRGALVDHLRRNDWLTGWGREHVTKVRDAIRDYRAAHGTKPSVAQIAEQTGMSEEAVLRYLSYERWDHVSSLDAPREQEDCVSCIADLLVADTETPQESLEWQEKVERLAAAIERLPERQKQTIVMYYYEDLYMSEIAEVFGLSEGRISQLHTQALYNLSRYMEEQ